MNLTTHYLTKNDCYKAGKKITVKGLMIHSTGANNPKLSRYIDDPSLGKPSSSHWNQPEPGGRQVCVHGFIGLDKEGDVRTIQTLPWNHRGWGGGGKSNNTHIHIEICEGDLNDAEYFDKVYKEAVELFAYLADEFNLDEHDIITHCEGYDLGVASNHADVMHWFPKHDKSMNTFRADVKALMGGKVEVVSTPKETKVESEIVTKPSVSKPVSNGDATVKAFQGWLNRGYKTKLETDGHYGPKTQAGATKAFQTELNRQFRAGLAVDGEWGPKTKSKSPTVRKGASGNITRIIQGMLYSLGHNPRGLDGIYGDGTVRAVVDFQGDNKLSKDGIAGPNTLDKMFR